MPEYSRSTIPRRRPHLLALEPRMMFDAAAAVTMQDAVADGAAPAHSPVFDAHPAEAQRDTSAITAHAAPDALAHDVIFIDTAVDDYRQLAAEWAGRGQIVLIDGTRDGIAQMQTALAGRSDIGAIHIVGHGGEGMLRLGTTRIDTAAIRGGLATALGEIGQSLGAGGDILIYGCDFAAGSDGATALAAFAAATRADVAASTDVTGYGPRGGDWTLEARIGGIAARGLDSADWVHTLDPNTPTPIAVTADSLTVVDGAGTIVVDGATGYGSDARSPDVGVGAVAVWHGAALFNGQAVDLRATVVSISAGDALRFNRPTGSGATGDDATFLLRDLTTANDASVQIRWDLVLAATGDPLAADVRFTIADIDGVGGNPNTRESVTAATAGLAYYTHERNSDIDFVASLADITASGTQDENTDAAQPLTSRSAATFDWSEVSSFTLTYKLITNATRQAQFFHDGDADFAYSDPVYVGVPRLDLDGDDGTATGNDAHFTFTEDGASVPIVDADLVVGNPMDIDSIIGASVRLTNYRAGDTFAIGTLPANITAGIGAVSGGAQAVTLSGLGSESDYAAALGAITFRNTSDTPETTQRVIDITFSNDTLTSATATSRIDVIPANDAPTAVDDRVATPEDTVVTFAVLGNDGDPDGDPLNVTAASALHGAVMRNADGTLTYMPSTDFNGADTITYTISDGRGGTSTAAVAVTVVPQPDALAGSVPGGQGMAEDATLIFSAANGNAITVSDADGGQQTVTLAVTHGTLTLGGTTGLTFVSGDGIGDATMRFTGSVAAINAALDGTAFSPDADYNGSAQVSLDVATVPVQGEDFVNGDLEAPRVAPGNFYLIPDSDIPGWRTTATDHRIEVWGNGHRGVTAFQGTQFFEINATQASTLYQDFRSVAGSAISVDFAHRGRDGNDVMQVSAIDLGADGLFGTADDVVLASQQYTDGNTAWGSYTKVITNAASGNLIRVEFSAISTATSDATAGNFIDAVALRQAGIAASDQDGIAISIMPVTDIAPDLATTAPDTAVTLSPLANDGFEAPSRAIVAIDGAAITAGGAAVDVANGTVRLDTADQLVFTPVTNYHGTTSFTYTVASGGVTETATEMIVVNTAPSANGTLPARATTDSAAISYATAGAFSDADGDTLAYSASGLPAGLTIDAATGIISGTIDRSASQAGGGSYAVVVTARDPSNATTMQRFTLTVTNPAPIARDDGATTREDMPVTIVVLGNDGDPDGDPLAVTGASALHGSVAINADGTLLYTPIANYNGNDTITYTISDGQGGTATANVAVTIVPANDAPTMAGSLSNRSSSDAAAVSYATAGAFSDIDGDALTYTATGLPTGLTIDAATGVISGTIDRSASQTGGSSYDIAITARDPAGAAATQNFTLLVANPGPAAVDDTATTSEDMPVTIVVLGNDGDPDGDPLTVTGASALHGDVAINPDGTITYRPDIDYHGGDTITYIISDGQGGTATARVAVTIAPVDDAPVALGPLPAQATTDGATVLYPVAAGFSDPDGDTLTYAATGLPAGLAMDARDGTISGTVDRSASQVGGGIYTILITATDPDGATGTQSFTLAVANPAPTARDDAITIHADTPAIVAVLANDRDPDGDPLTVTGASAIRGTVTIDPDGSLRYVPPALFTGRDTVTYTIADGQGGVASATLAIDVVNAPPVAADDGATTTEDMPVVITVLGNDGDPDGDAVTVVSADADHGRVTINPAGTLTYRPDADFNGADQLRYTISDGHGGRSSAIVAVTVTPVDDAPTTSGLAPRTTGDGMPASVPTAPAFGDVEGDVLTYTATGLPPGLAIDPATGTISGTITPGAVYGGPGGDGVYHAIVTATDPSGASADAPFDWTVAPAVPAPRDDNATTPEDTAVTIPVLANDSDLDGDRLTIVAANADRGMVTIAGDSVVFTPAADFNGIATITYTVADPSGNRATATVTVTVTAVNDAPVAVPLPPAGANDRDAVSLDVGGFFADPDGDALGFTATGLPPGLTIDPATGRIAGTIDRAASRAGTYRVTVTATDPSGAVSSSRFDWTIVNPAPIARDDTATTPEDTAVAIAILGNDGDPDGDPLTIVDASAGHGSVMIGPDGMLRYTPDADFYGNDVIVYTVADADGGRASASVLVTVTAVNDAPIARQPAPPAVIANDGAPVAIDASDWFRDSDGDALTYTATGLPAGLTIDPATGQVRGTLDRSASQPNGGGYAVVVTARDPRGATATANLDIRAANPAPVARDDASRTPQNGAGVTIPVLANDGDPDGDPLRVIAAVAANGVVTINPDGSVRYVPGAEFTGGDTIRYTISDGEGGTATATVAITVDPVNRAPIVPGADPVATTGGRPVTVAVLPGIVDPDGDRVAITSVTAATGVVTVNPDNTITFTPPLGFLGTTTIGYTVSDGRGGTTTGTILVRVGQEQTADIERSLRIGAVAFHNPTPALATIIVGGGVIRNPISLIETVDTIRSLRGTGIGEQPVGDAVEAIRSLRGTGIDPDAPITAEVARLDTLRDRRDAGDRLFDHRWSDFMVTGLTGFSTAADAGACIMIDSVVRGGAIHLEVRDTAVDGARAAIRSVDIRLARGDRPGWITVDPRGMAIIERAADMDELHLIVRVTRTDGSASSTPILVQGQTGEVELDRKLTMRRHADPLDLTLQTPNAAIQAEAARLASYFQ